MIPDSKNPYPMAESIILDILSTRPRLSVRELYALFLQKNKKKVTIQALYALIRRMIDQRILVKEGQALLIDASWVAALMKFTDTVQATYLSNEATGANTILRPGEKRDIVFENVMAMDNFWTNALIIALYRTKEDNSISDRNVYGYNYHSWFQIARTAQEQSLAEAYEQAGMGYYILSGSNLFLDKAVVDSIETEGFRYQTIKPNAMLGVNYYIAIIGNIIFEMSLPQYIHELMENIYKKTKNITGFDRQEILRIIQLPARTTLTITNDKKRAEKLCRSIKGQFFGIAK